MEIPSSYKVQVSFYNATRCMVQISALPMKMFKSYFSAYKSHFVILIGNGTKEIKKHHEILRVPSTECAAVHVRVRAAVFARLKKSQ